MDELGELDAALSGTPGEVGLDFVRVVACLMIAVQRSVKDILRVPAAHQRGTRRIAASRQGLIANTISASLVPRSRSERRVTHHQQSAATWPLKYRSSFVVNGRCMFSFAQRRAVIRKHRRTTSWA